jgi:hypothetical protein
VNEYVAGCEKYSAFQPDGSSVKTREPIPLSNELNMSILAQIQTYIIYGAGGVNVYPWTACGLRCVQIELDLRFSTIDFYVNNSPPSDYACTPDLIPDHSHTSVSLFSTNIYSLNLNRGNKYSSQAICPYVFKNSNIAQFFLSYQVDSFLFVNLLRFQADNDTKKISINSNINYLSLQAGNYNYKLDTGLLHPVVFEKVNKIDFYGTIKSIQTDLFKNFDAVTARFHLTSLGNFFHQIGIEWINYFSDGSHVSFDSNLLYAHVLIPYNYPDQDLCIFTQLSFNKKIYIDFNCCYQPAVIFAWFCKIGIFGCSGDSTNVSDDTLSALVNSCKVTTNNKSNSYPIYLEYYQIRLISMLSMQLLPFVLIPSSCLVGLFLNWKIIQTIQTNKKKDLKEKFYEYMSANAKFNCIYCLIFAVYPMTSCDWRQSVHFCSSIFRTRFVQYYKIVMMAYFGEIVKMCANATYLMMTLNRYLLVGKDHPPWLVTVANLKFKWMIRGSILFSVLVNIGHGMEYQVIEDAPIISTDYFTLNGFSYSDYPQANQGFSYYIYSAVYFAFNFGVFFILNTGVEVKLVRRMHKELREKRERLAKMNAEKSSASTELACKREEKMKAEEDDLKKERKVIKMVVFNGVLNFVLRTPELLFCLEYLCHQSDLHTIFVYTFGVYMPGFLSFMADIGYFTYTLTFTTNFAIFYTFNKNFKDAVVFRSPAKAKV